MTMMLMMLMTSYSSWLLLGASTGLMAVVYLLINTLTRKRRSGEPPIVPGNIVFGNAAQFASNAVQFLHDARRRHGNVFTIRLLNQYMTVVMDPHSYTALSQQKTFDFEPIQRQVNWNVFHFILRQPRKMIKETGRTVGGRQLLSAMQAFVQHLNVTCTQQLHNHQHHQHQSTTTTTTTTTTSSSSSSSSEGEWRRDGLHSLTSRTMFDAVFSSVFGRDVTCPFSSHLVYDNFQTFHRYFNYFWLGLPKVLFPAAMKALGNLLVMPDAGELLARPDLSSYLRTAIQMMLDNGHSEADIKGHNLVYLHVNYNTFRLAFWAVAQVMCHDEALAAVTAEINELIHSRLDLETTSATLTIDDVDRLPVLDSIMQETCRLSSGVFMVRHVTADTWFTTSDGKTHLIRQGDRVAIYPPAIHKDPQVYYKPLEFVYDRFLQAGGQFYESGHVLKHPVIAFGSLCPGRRYALLQIKWFMVVLLSRCELRLAAGQQPPVYDVRYHGHEVLPPVSDVDIEYRVHARAVELRLAD